MSSETAVETKYCSNCKKDIAAANFTMHEVHCRRHLVLCEHCLEPVPRTEMEQHFTDVHAKVPCSQCSLELEKDHLESHLENDCPKRQVSCEYCELQLPHCDLGSHLEFCSTRTEACPRCNNFIMHKDLLRHNSSNCAYPEVRPSASQANGVRDHIGGGEMFRLDQRGGFFGHGQLDDSFDPFEFEEIRRALEGDLEGRGMQSLLMEDSDASAAAAGEQRRDMDYDTMLAMQLAAEDNKEGAGDVDPDVHLNQLISSYESRSRSQRHRPSPLEMMDVSVPASSPPANNEFTGADEDIIPCEFCGDTFPAFALVHHQSVCDPLASGLWGPGQDNPEPSFGRNNELLNQRKPVAARPPTIPVINNLGSASPAQEHQEERNHHLSDNGDHLFRMDSLEMTMLPCEFCYELLPADSLVQHQAMCEGKPVTPRVTTPAAAQPSSGFSTRNQRYNFFPTSTTAGPRPQQSDPTEELLAAINQRGQDNIPGSNRPKKRPNVPRTTNLWSRGSPPQRRDSSSRDTPEEPDIAVYGRRGSRQGPNRQDSASRTRHTLNSLLSDEGSENQAPARFSVREGGGQNRQAQGARRRTGNADNRSNSSFVTGVSSRTVHRQMQPQHNRRHRPRGDTATEEEMNPGNRRSQRERGDHVFNNPANTQHTPNSNRHRRSSDRQNLPGWE